MEKLMLHSAFLMTSLAALTQALLQQSAPASSGSAQAPGLLHYTLPPEKLAQAYALYRIDVSLYLVGTLYIFAALYLMLRLRYTARLRDLAERTSRFWLVRGAMVIVGFLLTLDLVELPFSIYRHRISLAYGLSVQPWGSWFGDWAKALGLNLLIAVVMGWILYGALRHSPRRWWFYFWLVTIPVLLFGIFLQPILIDPIFNKFEPLTANHTDLVEQIERVVQRAGTEIPRSRMYEMKASEKTTELNAYVTGFGSSKRIVVWDTTMRHLDPPETLFVVGHEMGHYVLRHIVKGFLFSLLLMLVLFYLAYRLATLLVARYGMRWGIRELSDFASAPLLLLIVYGLTFLSTPVFNAVSRHMEHEADIYGVEVIHGLVPNASLAGARGFQVLGERSLDYPYVGKFAEFWLWSHPTIADRMIFVQVYNPWAEGKQPQFVK